MSKKTWWRYFTIQEIENGELRDLSGNGNKGIVNNVTFLTLPPRCRYMDFSGEAEGTIFVAASNPSLLNLSPFSFSLWFRKDDSNTDRPMCIGGKAYSYEWWLGEKELGLYLNEFILVLWQYRGPSYPTVRHFYRSHYEFEPGKWHYITGSFQPGYAKMMITKEGERETHVQEVNDIFTTLWSPNSDFELGRFYDADTEHNWQFDGYIAEAIIRDEMIDLTTHEADQRWFLYRPGDIEAEKIFPVSAVTAGKAKESSVAVTITGGAEKSPVAVAGGEKRSSSMAVISRKGKSSVAVAGIPASRASKEAERRTAFEKRIRRAAITAAERRSLRKEYTGSAETMSRAAMKTATGITGKAAGKIPEKQLQKRAYLVKAGSRAVSFTTPEGNKINAREMITMNDLHLLSFTGGQYGQYQENSLAVFPDLPVAQFQKRPVDSDQVKMLTSFREQRVSYNGFVPYEYEIVFSPLSNNELSQIISFFYGRAGRKEPFKMTVEGEQKIVRFFSYLAISKNKTNAEAKIAVTEVNPAEVV